jgi:hypothetical protein
VPIDKAASSEIVTLSVTLDDLGIFTSELAEMQELGLFPEGEQAWAIYLPDLMIVSEILLSPAQFLHYVGWRRSLFESKGVRCQDEVNWLGIYLKEGPQTLMRPADFQFLTFTTYTTDFDDYFLFKMGQRSKPMARPVQWMPKEMSALISRLEALGTWGFTRVTNPLLDLGYPERKELAKMLRRRAKSHSNDLVFEGQNATVKLLRGHSSAACEEQAQRMSASSQRVAVVLSFNPDSGELEGWGTGQP